MYACTHIQLSEPLGCLIKQAGINIHTIPICGEHRESNPRQPAQQVYTKQALYHLSHSVDTSILTFSSKTLRENMTQQNKRLKTNGLDDSQAGPSNANVSQLTPDARALARSEQVIIH